MSDESRLHLIHTFGPNAAALCQLDEFGLFDERPTPDEAESPTDTHQKLFNTQVQANRTKNS